MGSSRSRTLESRDHLRTLATSPHINSPTIRGSDSLNHPYLPFHNLHQVIVMAMRAARILNLLTIIILSQKRSNRAMETALTHLLPVLLGLTLVMRQQEASPRLLGHLPTLKLKMDPAGVLQVIITMSRRQDNKHTRTLTLQISQRLSNITRQHMACTRTTKPSNLTHRASLTKRNTILISLLTPRHTAPILMAGKWRMMI